MFYFFTVSTSRVCKNKMSVSNSASKKWYLGDLAIQNITFSYAVQPNQAFRDFYIKLLVWTLAFFKISAAKSVDNYKRVET